MVRNLPCNSLVDKHTFQKHFYTHKLNKVQHIYLGIVNNLDSKHIFFVLSRKLRNIVHSSLHIFHLSSIVDLYSLERIRAEEAMD